MTDINPDELRSNLGRFTGTEHHYPHPLARFVKYTDGALYLAKHAKCFWLLDEIALAQRYVPEVKREDFQVWKLIVADSRAALLVEDGNGNVVHQKTIGYTDFPLDHIELYCERDDEKSVILLPTEH
jgi:hypothetical protein